MVGHVSLELRHKDGHGSLDTEPCIRLREITIDGKSEFRLDRAAEIAGYVTDVAKAELFDVSDRTLRRVRQGVLGEDFMAKAVDALTPFSRAIAKEGIAVSLDGLFEVVR